MLVDLELLPVVDHDCLVADPVSFRQRAITEGQTFKQVNDVLDERGALEECHSYFHLHLMRFVKFGRLPTFCLLGRAGLLGVVMHSLQAYFRLSNCRSLLKLFFYIENLVSFPADELLPQFFFCENEHESFQDRHDLWNSGNYRFVEAIKYQSDAESADFYGSTVLPYIVQSFIMTYHQSLLPLTLNSSQATSSHCF